MPSWRNPATGLFESGTGPAVGQEGVSINTPGLAPEVPQEPAPTPLHERAWDDFVPTPGNPLEQHVESVDDVLRGGQPHKDESEKEYGPTKADDVVGG